MQSEDLEGRDVRVRFHDGPAGLLALRVAGPSFAAARAAGALPAAFRGGTGGPRRRAIVLVHDDAMHGGHWAAVQRRLARRHDTLALDLRGHGGSEPPVDGDHSIEGRAVDVAEAIRALALDRPDGTGGAAAPLVLVGHGAGASVALCYAAMYPERVHALLLLAPPGDERGCPPPRRAAALAALVGADYARAAARRAVRLARVPAVAGGRGRAHVARRAAAEAALASQGTLIGTLRARWRWDPARALRGVRGHRYVLYAGGPVPGVPLEALDPSLRVQRLPDAGHWLPLERPALVARWIRALAGRGRVAPDA